MASRRALKKNVNYIISELFDGCIMTLACTPSADKEEAGKITMEILKMHKEFISRISHTEPGNVKGFYKKFRSDFNAKAGEIIDAIGKLQ